MHLLETDEVRKCSLQEPGFVAETELAAQSASTGALTEVPINYRPRIGSKKLSTWRHGFADSISSLHFGEKIQSDTALFHSGEYVDNPSRSGIHSRECVDSDKTYGREGPKSRS
jgi:hypothetical protein